MSGINNESIATKIIKNNERSKTQIAKIITTTFEEIVKNHEE